MNRESCRLSRSWLSMAIAGIAVLGVLTACSGSHENTAPQGGRPGHRKLVRFVDAVNVHLQNLAVASQ